MRRGILLAALLLAATWAAAGAEAQEDVRFVLAPGTGFEATPWALLLQSTDPLQFASFTLRADRITVYEGTMLSYPIVPGTLSGTDKQYRNSTVLTNASISIDGPSQDGYVGIHSHVEDTRIRFTASAPCVVERSSDSEIRAGGSERKLTDDHNNDSSPYFYRRIREDHLRASCLGDLRFQGEHLLQVDGLTLRIEADQGVHQVRTGTWEEASPLLAPIPRTRRQWAAIESEEMTIEASSPVPWDMALREVRTSHVLITPDRVHILQGTLLPAGAPLGRAGPDLFLASAWVFAGCAVLGSSVLFHRARRRRLRTALEDAHESWDPEECVQRAEIHIQAERFDRALEWIVLARRMAPTSASACATQAFLLGMLDRVDEALASYRDASQLSPEDGEHDLSAARLALERQRPHAMVEEFLERALKKTPRLVQEVDEQGEFGVLAGRPRFERAVADAWDAFVGHVSRDGPD